MVTQPSLQFATSFDGARIAFRDQGGSGRPVLFLAGWCCPQTHWDKVVDLLDHGMRAITMDYAGFGQSGHHRRQWAIENFARDARAVLESLDLKDVVVVGHSMGGAVALELAYLCPDQVAQAIGVDTFTYTAFYNRFDERLVDQTMAGLRDNFAATIIPMLGTYFLPDTDPGFIAGVLNGVADTDPEAGAASMENFLRWDVSTSLAKCPCPVGLINSRDFLDTEAAGKLGLPIETIAGVGHFLMIEKPSDFVVQLEAMVKRLDV